MYFGVSSQNALTVNLRSTRTLAFHSPLAILALCQPSLFLVLKQPRRKEVVYPTDGTPRVIGGDLSASVVILTLSASAAAGGCAVAIVVIVVVVVAADVVAVVRCKAIERTNPAGDSVAPEERGSPSEAGE